MARQRARFTAGIIAAAALALVALAAPHAHALKVGSKVSPLKVRDANDKPRWMPDIGKKVVTIFYTDPDVKDQNEPFRELLKAQKLDKKIWRSYGVVNLKDTWKPNFIIRKVIRNKIAKFKALILTDKDHTLKKKWGLGDCNEKDVVIVIGKDRRVKYIKMGQMFPSERKKALELIKSLGKSK